MISYAQLRCPHPRPRTGAFHTTCACRVGPCQDEIDACGQHEQVHRQERHHSEVFRAKHEFGRGYERGQTSGLRCSTIVRVAMKPTLQGHKAAYLLEALSAASRGLSCVRIFRTFVGVRRRSPLMVLDGRFDPQQNGWHHRRLDQKANRIPVTKKSRHDRRMAE